MENLVAPPPSKSPVSHENLNNNDILSNDNTNNIEVLQNQREKQVKVFVKQLLTAIQYLHHRNIVHLDLRPEAILLQDDHLILADFGQSRHLLCGKVNGNIKSTPEFVSPEIISGLAITLSSDMWSLGVLTYIL